MLDALRAACAAEAGLTVGGWYPAGMAPGDWGTLAQSCGHPGEGDALVSYGNRPVALLRRRWHLIPAGDPDAAFLQSVGLFELISPGGRDMLSSLHQDALLDELLAKLAPQAV